VVDVTARRGRGLSGVNLYISCEMPLTVRVPRQLRILALALVAAGCHSSDATGIVDDSLPPGIQSGTVSVTPTNDGLSVVNLTPRPIYFLALNAEYLALIDWIPCFGGTGCPTVAQGQQRVIPWSSVVGYSASTRQFTLIWWHGLVLPDGTARMDGGGNVTVTR
jgi:hypothetical protein